METLKTNITSPAAECPLRHPLTTHPKDCATCTGVHSPAQDLLKKDHWLGGILRYRLPRAIYDCAWGTLHWNSHFIASTAKPWKQSPQPGPIPFHFRLSYFVMSAVVSVLATFAFGLAIAHSHPTLNYWQGGVAMLLIAGPGWAMQALLALAVKGAQSYDYLGHLSTVMWRGVVPLAVVSLVALVVGSLSPYFFAAAVLMSSLMMARAHFHRVHVLGLSQAWTLTWFLLLQLSAWGMIVLLPFVQPIVNWK